MGTLRFIVASGAWFLPLTAGSGLGEESPDELVQHESSALLRLVFCWSVHKETSPQRQNQPKGTYMYAPQTSESKDCAGAAEYWRAAVSNFPSLPPAYSADELLYTDVKNVSFVGLFNSREEPALDCAVITCRAKAQSQNPVPAPEPEDTQLPNGTDETESSAAAPGAHPDGEGQGDTAATESTRRLSAETGPVYSMICLSSPRALQETIPPFTEEQWAKIKGDENGSRHSKVFVALSCAAAALVHLLF
ncbi:hypothetical protein Emag_001508 [Eimeria magna]